MFAAITLSALGIGFIAFCGSLVRSHRRNQKSPVPLAYTKEDQDRGWYGRQDDYLKTIPGQDDAYHKAFSRAISNDR